MFLCDLEQWRGVQREAEWTQDRALRHASPQVLGIRVGTIYLHYLLPTCEV